MMGMTLAEKILARAAGRSAAKAGDIVEPVVNLAMSHENASLVINRFHAIFQETGLKPKVWDPSRIAIIFDHRVPAESSKTATNQKRIREFVQEQGITKFHDIRGDEGGICHQILPENGYVKPGDVVVGTDSHTTTHGALGAFAFGIGATEMAAVWALGKGLNVQVPTTLKVVVSGQFQDHVSAKDLILFLIHQISTEGASFKALEFHGETIDRMSTAGRLVVCNMAVEAGATAGMVPADEETIRYLRDRADMEGEICAVRPDKEAVYEEVVEVDVSALPPQVACPHSVDNVGSVESLIGQRIDQIVIGSCTNGRLEDLETAAAILKGKQIDKSVRLLIFPASWRIYREALKKGYLEDLVDAGAVMMNPGCGCCLGVHEGALGDGEVALSTTNRNFKGRMGNSRAEIFLCSPAVAAASAVTGVVSDPRQEES